MTSTITNAQILALRTEAAIAGDSQTVRDCDAAIDGDVNARESVAGDIAAAAAMDDGEDAEDAYWAARDNERRAAGF